jgi:hypothetical protein
MNWDCFFSYLIKDNSKIFNLLLLFRKNFLISIFHCKIMLKYSNKKNFLQRIISIHVSNIESS